MQKTQMTAAPYLGSDPRFVGKWYVPAYRNHYLHTDGEIRHGCYAEDKSQWSGYFDSEQEATAAIKKLEEANGVNPQ
jgi:hypothetical protein